MLRTFLKAKLHRACVTHAELHYEGSCAIDGDLLDTAGIADYEQIQIYNITNGQRFTTYAIRAKAGSKIISINGAAAHKAQPKDRIIICSYVLLNKEEIQSFKPTLVYLNKKNQLKNTRQTIPIQME